MIYGLSDEALRAAWQHCKRAAWPATFEACMSDPVISRLIAIFAKHGRGPAREHEARRQRRTQRDFHSAGIDRKRLASGERDED